MALTVALALACLWPVIWAYGHVAYLMIMPVDRAELTDGRNVLFLTLMKGSYELKIFGDMCAIGENAFSVNGSIKTSSATNIVNGQSSTCVKDGACYSWFECKNGVERVEITLDVHLSTNSVNVSAEVFPRK